MQVARCDLRLGLATGAALTTDGDSEPVLQLGTERDGRANATG